MRGGSESLDLSMEADFEIVEREGEVLAGFESSGDSPEFDDMYEPERWLEYLLDPGDGASVVSEKYHENTTALQLVGLTLVDELLEHDETRELLQGTRKTLRRWHFWATQKSSDPTPATY